MYTDFDENIKPEYIILSDLKNYNLDYHDEYYYYTDIAYEREQKNPNKPKEEIKLEIAKEVKNEMNLYQKQSVKYFQIDKQKNKELEQIFNREKVKLNFNSVPKVLSNGKIYTYEFKCFTLYNNKLNKELEIKFEEKIISVDELDNKDLVLLIEKQYENEIIIFRLKNGKYSLFQKIDEYGYGYKTQMRYSGCQQYIKEYRCKKINAISGNRFICISNYGFKMYALDEKKEYSVVLLKTYDETITKIYELDKDNFIFFSTISYDHMMGSPAHNVLILDKIKIIEKNGENNNKIENEKDNNNNNNNNISDSFFELLLDYGMEFNKDDFNNNNNDNINNDDDDFDLKKKKKEIENLNKYKCEHNKFFEFSKYNTSHYFRGDVLFKDKYLIVGIEHYILLFDISSGKLLKRYVLLYPGEENFYKQKVNIYEWNKNKNEFIADIKGNIYIFKLTDDNELKIIAHTYFKEIKDLEKIGNKFYQFNSKRAPKNSKYYYIEELYIYY